MQRNINIFVLFTQYPRRLFSMHSCGHIDVVVESPPETFKSRRFGQVSDTVFNLVFNPVSNTVVKDTLMGLESA